MATKTVLSNVDLIRRFVFDHGPATADEIAEEVCRQMQSVGCSEVARDRYVLPVLRAQPYYRETDGRWQIVIEEMPEFRALRQVMEEERRLLYEREIRSKTAKKLGIKVQTVVLDLELAPGLARHGSHWGLAEWVIANDQAAEVLEQHQAGLNEKDLLKAVCERTGLAPEITILHLKGDKQKRFVADRKLWYLKKHYSEKQKERAPEKKISMPELKAGEIDLGLEGSFLEAQAARIEEEHATDIAGKARLKKALKRQAQELLEQRETSGKPEDFSAWISQVLGAAGVDEHDIKSFERVESAPKEQGLSAKEREEIQGFVDQLLGQETVGVGAPLPSVVNAPLSARKMQDVLRLKYLGYSRDRAVLPSEYYRLLVEILKPTINDSVLHPACFDGNLAVELLNYLFDRLDGAAWALAEGDSSIEIVQPDGAHYQLSSKDTALLEVARDKFLITQVDLVNHFLNFKFTGIEADKVLASAARIVTRLSGFENAYIVSRDYLSELPEIFNHAPNESNTIPDRFDLILGNFTFTQDANLAANYLNQSLTLLADGGRAGVFVLGQLLRLLVQHGLLADFLQGMAVTHYIRLPVIEGRHEVAILVLKELGGEEAPAIVDAVVADFKSANNLSNALQQGSGAGELYGLVDQGAFTALID